MSGGERGKRYSSCGRIVPVGGIIIIIPVKGKLLNAVTSGEWTAGRIVKIDTEKKQIYLYGYGKEKGRNPNYTFVYRVGFNGKKITLLTPENATHGVFIHLPGKSDR